MLTCISNTDHSKEVLSRIPVVKHTLYIGTADIAGLYVEVGRRVIPDAKVFILHTETCKTIK